MFERKVSSSPSGEGILGDVSVGMVTDRREKDTHFPALFAVC